MKKILYFLDHFVFLATTLAIASVFYEGMTLKWFGIVGIFIICMDYSFLLTTVINIWAERKSKWFYLHIFSAIMLLIAIVMKLLKLEYPAVTLVLWYFYIWFVYGIRIIRRYIQRS